MEQRVISEYEKFKDSIYKALKERFHSKLNEDELNFILRTLREPLENMIKLMKEGKSVHEKFFSDIILNSVDAVIGIDNEFKIFLWNKGAQEIFSYTKEEAIGRDFTFLMPPWKVKDGERDFLIKEARQKGYLANYETERLTKDGSVVNVSITRFEIYDEQKKSIGSVGIVRDITLVKKLEKELREKENLALIGEVVSSIAHSISNPLNIISGNADYLLLDKKENDKEFEELKTILDEATRIAKAIRHLLNFSRPLKINLRKDNLNNVINEVVKNTRFILGNKDIAIKKMLKEIPAFEFDNVQMQEVITNIVTNSIQAVASKGEIKIKSYSENKVAVVEITDNGPGIPKENLEKIFNPFYSSKEYGKGTGLGLSIAKRIIKEHGGDINVKSHVGKGTTFNIILPIS